MACSGCCACTASFTFLMFLIVCHGAGLRSHQAQCAGGVFSLSILGGSVFHACCAPAFCCTQERPRPLLTAATELRAGSSPEGSRALLGRRGSFFNILLKYSSRIRTAKKSPGCHVPCHSTGSWADLQCFFARVVPWELLGVQFWALSRSLCEQRGVSSACLKEPTSGEPCGWACPSPSS